MTVYFDKNRERWRYDFVLRGDAVYFTPGLTMGSLLEKALIVHLDRVEKQRGEPIPSRKGAAATV